MLNKQADKLESRSEVMLFIGYPKETNGSYFYDPKDQKIVVSTNSRFLEEDYISNHKSRVEIILEELQGDPEPLRQPVVPDSVPQATAQSVNTAPDHVRLVGG